jgi:SAM-dependent methyltransferase
MLGLARSACSLSLRNDHSRKASIPREGHGAVSNATRPATHLPRLAGRTIFGSDIAGYHTARPGYPEELYQLIEARLPARDTFGEIGPGTGLATEALARLGPRRFVAFEPDPLLAEYLRKRFAGLEVLAEDFCLAETPGEFDLIASASSFHWLEPGAALRKARSLLKPGGCLAIWWNVYRQTGVGDPFAEAVAPLLADLDLPPSQTAEEHYSLDVELHRGCLEAAGFVNLDHRVFRRQRTLAPADARALYASFSLVRLLPPDAREALLDAIASVVKDRFSGAAPSVLLSPIYLAAAPPSVDRAIPPGATQSGAK